MQFKDIFKANFLERSATFSVVDTVISLALACALGLFIYLIYKKTYTGVLFSRSFGISLVALTMISTFVILAVTSNVVLSLGMVGALSIVRYRTAIKEPIDLLYMFWAITSGITVGAGMYLLALVGLIVMSLFIAVTFGRKSTTSAYILMVQYAGTETYDEILRELGRVKYRVKSKIFKNGIQELTLQITCSENKLMFVEKIQELTDVAQVSFVKYNGEYYG